MPLSHERLIAVLLDQTELLRDVVRSADPSTPVPTCPGWTIGTLVRHVAGRQRWAAEIVTARATAPPEDAGTGAVRVAEPEPVVPEPVDLDPAEPGPADSDPAHLDRALADSSQALARALEEAGPDAPLWTPLGAGTAAFFARRFAHRTAVHGADVALAAGRPWTVDADAAVDALDEWLELTSLPQPPELAPERDALLGPGRTVHLHATDTSADLDAEWVVDLTGPVPSWRRAHEKSAVAVRGPLTGLLLVVYGRQKVEDAAAEVFGDRALLDEWLAASAVGRAADGGPAPGWQDRRA